MVSRFVDLKLYAFRCDNSSEIFIEVDHLFAFFLHHYVVFDAFFSKERLDLFPHPIPPVPPLDLYHTVIDFEYDLLLIGCENSLVATNTHTHSRGGALATS